MVFLFAMLFLLAMVFVLAMVFMLAMVFLLPMVFRLAFYAIVHKVNSFTLIHLTLHNIKTVA
jgi:hypothetical protein